MSFEAVKKLEAALGQPLPSDYRAFLTTHTEKHLEPSLLVKHMVDVPGSSEEDVVSVLYTAADILDGDLMGAQEERMIILGWVEPGGYVYMCFAPTDFGAMYVRFPYESGTFYPVGKSFSEFLVRCRPEPEGDA